jgi:ribonuclease P protein component
MLVQFRSIKGYSSFSKVYSAGKKFRSNSATAVVIFNDEFPSYSNTNEKLANYIIYYGVTVSKKVAKKAVIRNRIKRILRESLRIEAKKSDAKKLFCIKKIIISYYFAPKHPMQISLNDILPAVRNILEQAYLHYENKLNKERKM